MKQRRSRRERQRAGKLEHGKSSTVSEKRHGAAREILLHLLLLAVVTFALYGGSLWNGFVADDSFQILDNRLITDPHYIPRIFTSNVWAFAQSSTSNYYRPLQMLIYLGEYSLYGPQPWPWHLFNLLAHLGVVFAAYALVRALSGGRLAFWSSLWFAFLAVHVEAVVWVAALPELLCAIFLFAGLYFYHRARDDRRPWRFHALASGCFLFGLLCKETAIVFPALLVAYEFFYRRESLVRISRGLLRFVPYAAVLGLYLVMRLEALGSFAPASGSHFKLTPGETFLSVSALFAQYVAKLLVPVNLNFFHVFHPTRMLGWKSVAGLALLVVLISAAFILRRTQPLLAFAVAWFLITLSPALSIANVGENVFTERYLYIPSFGFSIFAAWAWLELLKRARPQARGAIVAGLAAIFAFYAVQTIRRIADWRDDVTLYSKTAEQSPGSAYIQSQLGTAYYERGNLDQALNHYERAVAIDPNLALAQFNLGIALRDKGQPEQAVPHVRKAVELDRGRDAAWTQYGMALANLKQWDEAAECYRNALRTQPNDPEILTSLGEALSGKGDVAGAMQAYRQVIAAQPGNLDASTNLAILLMRSGSIEEAISLLATALQRSPDAAHADIAHFNLGICYEKKESWDLAAQEYEKALQLTPDFRQARQRLDVARQHISSR